MKHIVFVIMFVFHTFFSSSNSLLAQTEKEYLKFVIVAMTTDADTRISVENQLVSRLIEDQYNAVSSHTMMPKLDDLRSENMDRDLWNQGVRGILVLRSIDVGENASIKSIENYLTHNDYGSVEEFIGTYRGHNYDTQAVIQVAGYYLKEQRSESFWHGVIWLDDTVETRQEGIDRIIDLVQFNLNQSRSLLRARLGLPPLNE